MILLANKLPEPVAWLVLFAIALVLMGIGLGIVFVVTCIFCGYDKAVANVKWFFQKG